MQKGKIFTIENAEKLITLVNSGTKVAHAAYELGISRATAYLLMSWARKNKSKIKIKIKKPEQSSSAYPRALRLKMFEMYHSGSSYEAIEAETGVSPKTIHSIIRHSNTYVKYFNPPLKLRKCHNPTPKASVKLTTNNNVNEKGLGLPTGWANLLP